MTKEAETGESEGASRDTAAKVAVERSCEACSTAADGRDEAHEVAS